MIDFSGHLISTLPSPFSSTLVFSSPGPVAVARKGASPTHEVIRLPKRSKRQVARLPGWAAGSEAGSAGRSHRAGQVAAGRHMPAHVTFVSGKPSTCTETCTEDSFKTANVYTIVVCNIIAIDSLCHLNDCDQVSDKGGLLFAMYISDQGEDCASIMHRFFFGGSIHGTLASLGFSFPWTKI